MKNGHMWLLVCWLAAAPALAGVPATAFTYQGRLLDGGQPANDAYDLQFALSSAPIEGSYLGATLGIAPVLISHGLFTVTLDFGGGMFDGSGAGLRSGFAPTAAPTPTRCSARASPSRRHLSPSTPARRVTLTTPAEPIRRFMAV